MKKFAISLAFLAGMSAAPASAIEAYPAALAQQFVGWCTGAQNQPQTVCSCALNKAALEIPASAMASFLGAAQGGAMAATATGVGATALQIVTTCAAGGNAGGSTGTTGALMNSLGGALGR